MSSISFGPFSLDVAATRLTRDETQVKLRPRAFQALKALVLNSGQHLSHERIIADAWDGAVVSNHTVDVTIAEVKRALGEYGAWIRHRPKIGYCLEVPGSADLIKKGWHLWNRRTRGGFEQALACFQEAARNDSADFRAFEGVSGCYLMLATYGMRPPRDMYRGFLDAHGRAESLSGLTPELRCNRAHGLHMFERKLADAEAEFVATLRLKPTLGAAYIRLTMLYATLGRLDDAVRVLGDLIKIDPLLPVLPATETFVRLCRHEFDAAVASGRTGLDLHPYLTLGRSYYGQALELSGRANEALEQYRLAYVISPDLLWLRALEGACLARQDAGSQATAILEELDALRASEYVDAYFMALLHDALGDRNRAFQELERACEENSATLYMLDVDPKMDGLRSDPRFAPLRNRVFGTPGPVCAKIPSA